MMASRIFPGGPGRAEGSEGRGPRRASIELPTVDEMEERKRKGARRRDVKLRKRRLALGFTGVLLLAALVGGIVGIHSHRSAEALTRELQEKAPLPAPEVERQVDRLIDEIWKTEALEKLPIRR